MMGYIIKLTRLLESESSKSSNSFGRIIPSEIIFFFIIFPMSGAIDECFGIGFSLIINVGSVAMAVLLRVLLLIIVKRWVDIGQILRW